jgi:sugar lactone lactonase YvrE
VPEVPYSYLNQMNHLRPHFVSHPSPHHRGIPTLLVWFLAFVAVVFAIACTRQSSERPPLTSIRTLAGGGALAGAPSFVDPFGIAVSGDGVYVSDGETGRIWQFASDGSSKLVAENLDTPSGIALAPDGSVVVAETGAHTIKRVDTKSGQVSTIAGVENKPGFSDGDHAEALFDGPIGVAVSRDGTIFVMSPDECERSPVAASRLSLIRRMDLRRDSILRAGSRSISTGRLSWPIPAIDGFDVWE